VEQEREQVVRVAILDTNVAKGTNLSVLQALRQQGWRLRLSYIALVELFAHLPERATEIMPRLAKLATVLDPQERIAPTHAVLIDKLGGYVEGVASAGYYKTWRAAQGTTLDDWTHETTIHDLNQDTVRSLRALVDDRERDFVATMTRGRASSEARALVDAGIDDLATVTRRLTSTLIMPIHVTGGVQERFHLHFSLLALHGARAALFESLRAKGLPPKLDPNSTHDTNLAQHLAEGVFVATDDLKFIVNDVDATGSFQAPWVRTPWELLTVELPVGLPWGRAAKRARQEHVPRTIDGLREVEQHAKLAGT
jgi:hypothetical protein